MGDTLNLIENWLKILDNNYDARRVAYSTDMKDVFKQIPLKMIKSLTPKQKAQKHMIEIGG